MASHTVPAVSRSGWTPEARTGQRVQCESASLRQPHRQCMDRRLPRWKRWPVTAISDRACWTQLLQACPLQRPVPTVELHPSLQWAITTRPPSGFLIVCHNSIFPSQYLLPLECFLFQHWRPSCPFPKLRSQRQDSPPPKSKHGAGLRTGDKVSMT